MNQFTSCFFMLGCNRRCQQRKLERPHRKASLPRPLGTFRIWRPGVGVLGGEAFKAAKVDISVELKKGRSFPDEGRQSFLLEKCRYGSWESLSCHMLSCLCCCWDESKCYLLPYCSGRGVSPGAESTATLQHQ